jgi:FkbM family methyltransferase
MIGYFSQNDEDRIILQYFADRGIFSGFLVDIGAFDGMHFSNSRALLRNGWSGVLIEPLPVYAEDCRKLYQGKDVWVLQAAIGLQSGITGFNEATTKRDLGHPSEMLSTTNEGKKAQSQKWGPVGIEFQPIAVPQIGLKDLFQFLDEAGKVVKFLSIDVENTNESIFGEIPNKAWFNLECLCIEHDGNQRGMIDYAATMGFEQIGINAENLILGRKA